MQISPIRLGAVVLAATFTVWVVATPQKPTAGSKPASQQYTPEQVFSALMFNVGNATSVFPKVQSTAPRPKTRSAAAKSLQKAGVSLEKDGEIGPDDHAKLNQVAKDIAAGKARPAADADPSRLAEFVTEEIKQKDAKFFDRFRSEIGSGDQRRVEAVMTDASKLSLEILLGQAGTPSAQRASSAALARSIAINQNTFLNMDTAINVNVAYNVDTVKYLTHYWTTQPPSGRLRNEQLVNEITQAARGIRFR